MLLCCIWELRWQYQLEDGRSMDRGQSGEYVGWGYWADEGGCEEEECGKEGGQDWVVLNGR